MRVKNGEPITLGRGDGWLTGYAAGEIEAL